MTNTSTPSNDTLLQKLNASSVLPATRTHIQEWLECPGLPEWTKKSIEELITQEQWDELNNRFLKPISFGTGGMRGRTIAYQPTKIEIGSNPPNHQPDYAAVGASMINDFNIIQATIGLFNYTKKFLQDQQITTPPKLVIAYDVRFFSKHFGTLTAATWCQLGGVACLFKEPRSTPQLSFSIRHLKATAGIVITASHNPSHDNGYKVYFSDGGQIVSPHAEGIIEEVRKVKLSDTIPFLKVDTSKIEYLSEADDLAYQKAVENLILEDDVIKQSQLKVVYSPIHGTGQTAIVPILTKLGVQLNLVAGQMEMNGAFPTVQSPNPENSETLSRGIQTAQTINADLVLATDPDSDRMGVAVRMENGEYTLLNGNTIGALMADFYISQLKRLGFLPEKLNNNAALVTTFVTTPLLESIAKHYGLKTILTLTGFKFIGEKIHFYEKILEKKYYEANKQPLDLSHLHFGERIQLFLKYSTYFVFGAEESYGFLIGESSRDKDANLACALFCEMAAYLKSHSLTILHYLDQIYARHGYFTEDVLSINFEGATGMQKIQRILDSYRSNPPRRFGDTPITESLDFGINTIKDADDCIVPKQDFFKFELANGFSFAVRGSGTEPKIKFYFFAHSSPNAVGSVETLSKKIKLELNQLKELVKQDAKQRADT